MAQLIVLAIFAASALAFVGARYAVIRYAGATRFREGLFITRHRWNAASTLVKIGFCVAGPLAVYCLSALLFFVAFKLDGENRPGEPTQVRVAPGMPAEAAGVEDGDEISHPPRRPAFVVFHPLAQEEEGLSCGRRVVWHNPARCLLRRCSPCSS